MEFLLHLYYYWILVNDKNDFNIYVKLIKQNLIKLIFIYNYKKWKIKMYKNKIINQISIKK